MGFDITNFLNDESKKEIKNNWKPIRISVHKLRPAPGKENFYHMDDKEILETARTIELVGLQQYPVVKPIKNTDEYEIIAGHKRRLAVLKLLSEGKPEYEMIPCKIETAEDNIKNRLILIFTNSTQRERSDYEKMQEIKEVKRLLTEWKKSNKLPGRMQNVIAEILGTNKTKVGTLEKIDKKLIPHFMEEFEKGEISTNAANKLASMTAEEQHALYNTYKTTGLSCEKEARAKKEYAAQIQTEKQQRQETEQEKPKEEIHHQESAQTRKAVLLIDMPEHCEACNFYNWHNHACKIVGNDTENLKTRRQNNCPLTPLPERKIVCGRYPQPGPVPSYRIGWNDCLDEILKGENKKCRQK